MQGLIKWYFSLQGEIYGPVESKDVQNLLASGELSDETMLLREGEENWRPLREIRDILEMGGEGTYLGEPTRPQTYILELEPAVTPETSPSRPFIVADDVTVTQAARVEQFNWVILKAVEEAGKEKFLQEGPYSTSVVLDKIQKGELRYSDHCWRDGMSAWKALRDEPSFAALPSDEVGGSAVDLTPHGETELQIPDPIPLEDIGSVQFSSTEVHSMQISEAPPPEVAGEDLASEDPGDFHFTEESEVRPPIPEVEAQPSSEAIIQPSPEAPPISAQNSTLIELDEMEKSVTRAPIGHLDAFNDIQKPAIKKPAAEQIEVESAPQTGQSQVRQKLLEAQMAQQSSRPGTSPYMFRFLVLLIGALVLLIFGLYLAKDLGR